MSLLITKQRNDVQSDSAFSYRNNISNGFEVEPNSEIALIQSTINRGGNIIINKDRRLGVFFGNALPDGELFYKDDSGNKTEEDVPYSKISTTKDIPWTITIPKGTYTINSFASIVTDALNNQCPHPAFENHFTCEIKKNSANEFKGFRIKVASEEYDHSLNTRYPTDQVKVLARDGTGGSYSSGGDLTSPTGSKLSILYDFKQPIHPSEGGFKVTIPSGTMTNKWLIGLVRNIDEGNKLPKNKHVEPIFDHGAFTDQFDDDYNADIFDDYGGDFFDYVLVGNGTDIRLWHLNYDDISDRYTMVELEYWDTTTYGGASSFSAVAKCSAYSGATDIDFYVQNENIIINLKGAGLTSGQLPAVGSSNYSLYPKCLLSSFDVYGVNVRGCSRIENWDSNKDWWYSSYDNLKEHSDLVRVDYWRTQYVEGIIFDMDTINDNIPAGLWITDYRTSVTKTAGQIHNIDLDNPEQMVVLIAGDTTGGGYNYDGNTALFFGFNRIEDTPENQTPTLLQYETYREKVPELNSNNNIYVRINDLEMKTLNGNTSSISRIINSVPRTLGTGGMGHGILYHEPKNLIFLDLHNKEKVILNSIQIDMVNADETFATDLEDYTSNVFLIRKKQNKKM